MISQWQHRRMLQLRPISARSVGRPVPSVDRPQIGLGRRQQTDRARRLPIGLGRQLQIVHLIDPGRLPFIGLPVLALGRVPVAILGVRVGR
jgi:hypothetical protein